MHKGCYCEPIRYYRYTFNGHDAGKIDWIDVWASVLIGNPIKGSFVGVLGGDYTYNDGYQSIIYDYENRKNKITFFSDAVFSIGSGFMGFKTGKYIKANNFSTIGGDAVIEGVQGTLINGISNGVKYQLNNKK